MSDGATQSPGRRALRRFARNRLAFGGLVTLCVLALVCVIGPIVSPHAYDQVYRDYVKAAPSLDGHPTSAEAARILGRIADRIHARLADVALDGDAAVVTFEADEPLDERVLNYFARSNAFADARLRERQDEGRRLIVDARIRRLTFPLGADSNGRDLLTRILIGGRVSLLVALLASGVALIIGVAYGAVAGYFGGRVDAILMRVVDVLYALPFIFFVILLIAFFGRHFVLVFVAIGAVQWLDMARIVRGQALSLKRQDFVLAAEGLGVGATGILVRHIVPNLLGPVIAYLTLLAAQVILLESFLSFLGLGVQEPMTSLGALISDGARNIEDSPGLLIFPAVLLSAILFSLNFVGEGLRDALDARER